MKLYWSPRSPYVRKVLIVAHETGTIGNIDLERAVVLSTRANEDLLNVNPLGQIPTLVTDGGEAIYDSAVICRYLDVVLGNGALHPRDTAAELATMRRHALGDGLIWVLLSLLGERSRQQPEQSDLRIAAIRQKLPRIFSTLEQDSAAMADEPFNVGHAGIIAALCYLDFRLSQEWVWRERFPGLARWFAVVGKRPSVVATAYFDELAAMRALQTETTEKT